MKSGAWLPIWNDPYRLFANVSNWSMAGAAILVIEAILLTVRLQG